MGVFRMMFSARVCSSKLMILYDSMEMGKMREECLK